MLQEGKRGREVLDLEINQIRWDRRKIYFIQSKMKGMKKVPMITYPKTVMGRLRDYVGDRKGRVFVTRTGKPVRLKQGIGSMPPSLSKDNTINTLNLYS